MQTVKIIPITQRAKNRVREHGDLMELVKIGQFNGQPAILAKAFDADPITNSCWLGWFQDDEAVWKIDSKEN